MQPPRTASARAPFEPGSLVYKPYVSDGSAATQISDLLRQVRLAESAGFDGVCLSEHHLGVPGYLPNPLQAIGWILAETERVWAAAAPTLLLLRPTNLIAEELAWLAARHPGRVGAAFAAGAFTDDFQFAGTNQDNLAVRFEAALHTVSELLSGNGPTTADRDPALRDCRRHPIPVLSAASSLTACRRAARVGCGLLLESSITVEEAQRQVQTFRRAGGHGPVMLVRRIWLGDDPPIQLERRRDAQVRSTVPDYNRSAWLPPEQVIISGDADSLADELTTIFRVTGADTLNLRVHVPGLSADDVATQVALLANVIGPLRASRSHERLDQ